MTVTTSISNVPEAAIDIDQARTSAMSAIEEYEAVVSRLAQLEKWSERHYDPQVDLEIQALADRLGPLELTKNLAQRKWEYAKTVQAREEHRAKLILAADLLQEVKSALSEYEASMFDTLARAARAKRKSDHLRGLIDHIERQGGSVNTMGVVTYLRFPDFPTLLDSEDPIASLESFFAQHSVK